MFSLQGIDNYEEETEGVIRREDVRRAMKCVIICDTMDLSHRFSF